MSCDVIIEEIMQAVEKPMLPWASSVSSYPHLFAIWEKFVTREDITSHCLYWVGGAVVGMNEDHVTSEKSVRFVIW
jgi:hypothetical protein